ncbi:uncharacterized protein FSUBG_1077 [Fusarium subglutinans]|uniref:Uncharacterized protein n=1 Tax=Gibberella subglutinans TaxID=42677 RepID=A0A8H5QE64_GIBSU|nr:uncharacterized protein FSUBG_1077 [Fusarium subglutinans]KAF5612847.1 hypothetical protein FSUBG_1077 [Fusarium subglutinans]
MMEGQGVLMHGSSLTESPYLFSTVRIIFGDNSMYWVPVHLLEKYPKFRLSYDKDRDVVKLKWLNDTQTADFMSYLRKGKWKSQKPEDRVGSTDYYNRMQQCLSVHSLALDYEMYELAGLTFGEFTSMAGRLSVLDLVEMFERVNFAFHGHQAVLADYFTQRVAKTDEVIMADTVARLKRLSLVEDSDNIDDITPAEVSELKRKLQQYEEKYGPL